MLITWTKKTFGATPRLASDLITDHYGLGKLTHKTNHHTDIAQYFSKVHVKTFLGGYKETF